MNDQETNSEDLAQRFKKVFKHEPGFPEDMSLEEKVELVAERNRILQETKDEALKAKMKNIAKLSREVEKREKALKEEGARELKKLDARAREDGITFTKDGKVILATDKKRTSNTSAQTEVITNNDISTQNKAVATQTEVQSNNPQSTHSKKNTSEVGTHVNSENSMGGNLNNTKTQNQPQKHEHIANKPSQNSYQATQPKKEGFFSTIKKLTKKVLEILTNNNNTIYETHKTELMNRRNKVQNKNMDDKLQINNKTFHLTPGKTFKYQVSNVSINIIYSSQSYIGITGPRTESIMNFHINGKKQCEVHPGESFNYSASGLIVTVMNNSQICQQSIIYHAVLNKSDVNKKVFQEVREVRNTNTDNFTPASTPNKQDKAGGRAKS